MTIKTITELQAKPGQRAALLQIMEGVLASMKRMPGFLGRTTYEVIDDPDGVVEIAEWASPSARELWMAGAIHSGELKTLLGSLATPFKAINIRELD